MKKWLVPGLASLAVIACGTAPLASTAPTSAPPTGSQTASASPTASTSPNPTASPNPTTSPAPTTDPASNAVVVRIEQTGGMLPPWETLRWYPAVSLYADGRLVMQGPQIEIYPGPALPNLQVTRLSATGIDQVLAWAQEAGLQGPDRQLGPLVLDSGQTIFSVTYADGTTHHTSVTDMSASEPGIGALREFQDVLLSVRSWLGDDVVGEDEPYRFDRLRLISFPVSPEDIVDPAFVTELAWPLDEPLATLGEPISEPAEYRCAELAGQELADVLPLFERSNELTLWRSGDARYQLHLHPLLPDDEACPA